MSLNIDPKHLTGSPCIGPGQGCLVAEPGQVPPGQNHHLPQQSPTLGRASSLKGALGQGYVPSMPAFPTEPWLGAAPWSSTYPAPPSRGGLQSREAK